MSTNLICDYCGQQMYTKHTYIQHIEESSECSQNRCCKFHICGGDINNKHSLATLQLDKFTPLKLEPHRDQTPDMMWDNICIEDDAVIDLIWHIIGKNVLTNEDKDILNYLYKNEYDRMMYVFDWYSMRHFDFEDNTDLMKWIEETMIEHKHWFEI